MKLVPFESLGAFSYSPAIVTETAVLSVHNDLVYAIDNRHVSLLVLLDLSAAFGTVIMTSFFLF